MESERCGICGCRVHRSGHYAEPSVRGRSHATEHHYVPERFFGRSRNRPGTQRTPIFPVSPWKDARATGIFCYECHEELLHNPVFLPEDIGRFAELVRQKGLHVDTKPKGRRKIGQRIVLLKQVISTGLEQLLDGKRNGRRD